MQYVMKQLYVKEKKHANVTPQKAIKSKLKKFQKFPTTKGSTIIDYFSRTNDKATGLYEEKFVNFEKQYYVVLKTGPLVNSP